MIPINMPLLNGKEKEFLQKCIETGWISSDGPFVSEFERKFADFIGTDHGIAVCNGTAALETALFAAGVDKGDEVIMPAFTIISCALAAIRLGAVPVLVDAEPDTWNMDVNQIESRVTKKTKVIMAVHIYGHPVDMDPLLAIAKKHNLVVVEDAAEVHGAEYKGRKCGSIGNISAWSFYANKIITTGEGGMVLTSDAKMAERAASYRNLCFRPEKRFYHTQLGYNFRMTNMQAAIGLAQMERIEEFIQIKRRLGEYYRQGLLKIKGIKVQEEKAWAKMVYWMYCIELEAEMGIDADVVMAELNKKGIGTRPFFLGLHVQPALHDLGLFKEERYPVTERIAKFGLYLPSGMALKEKEIDQVVIALKEVLAEKANVQKKTIMEIITRTTCRLCGGDKLHDIFSVGEQYVNDFVPEDKIGKGLKAPLDLIMCDKCTLLQLRHTAPQELLYSRHYWYRSGVTDTMHKALRDITEQVETMVELKPGDVVLDIGANDGTMLATYTTKGIYRVGCEPADNLIDMLKEKTKYVMHDFWNYEKYMELASKWGFGKAKVITAVGMFYDLEDPNKFIKDAQRALADDGIFVAQLMCLAPMIQKNDLGNICHEHLEFYSLDSLKYLFETNGLEMFKIEENEINGGSYRIFARQYKGTGMKFNEKFTLEDIVAFAKRLENNRKLCVDFIKAEVAKGKTVYVYGASTKGNVILQYYGLDNTLIKAAAERSPEKWGKYTIGTWIPIVSEEEARKAQPDYFLVLPWAFFDEFYKREEKWRSRGGKFIVPLPEFRVVE